MTQKQQPVNPVCPECGHRTVKAGFGWSGRTKRQMYLCQKCGRRTMKKEE